MLVADYNMSPEQVMRMPFKRFLAWQAHAFRASIERKNEELKAKAQL